jgi:hypothetical protein
VHYACALKLILLVIAKVLGDLRGRCIGCDERVGSADTMASIVWVIVVKVLNEFVMQHKFET